MMETMTEQQKAFLRTNQLLECAEIIDCDPDRSTITTDDGIVHQVCEVYSRVMGYHRPVAAFNAGKQAEHRDRAFFKEPH